MKKNQRHVNCRTKRNETIKRKPNRRERKIWTHWNCEIFSGQFVRAAKVKKKKKKKKIRYGKQFATNSPKWNTPWKSIVEANGYAYDISFRRLISPHLIGPLNFIGIQTDEQQIVALFLFFSLLFSPFWQLSNCVTVKAPNNLSARSIPFNEYCTYAINDVLNDASIQ